MKPFLLLIASAAFCNSLSEYSVMLDVASLGREEIDLLLEQAAP
jgi:hypothetical protein